MRVEEVARLWTISPRQVYRLIKNGQLPATVRARDRPVLGYEVDQQLAFQVQKLLGNGHPVRGAIIDILKQVK